MPGTSTEQVVDKGIRQKIHKRVNSFTDGSAFCPGAPKRVPSHSEKHRRVYTSSNVCDSHEWRVDTASGKTLKKRSAVEKKIACLNGLRSEGVKLFLIPRFICFPPKAAGKCEFGNKLKDFYRMVRANATVIQKYPELICQQALNELDSSSCSSYAKEYLTVHGKKSKIFGFRQILLDPLSSSLTSTG